MKQTEQLLCRIKKKLKNNKSPGKDGIINELIKYGKDTLFEPLLKLFNKVYSRGIFPQIWAVSLLTVIHKSGSKKDPGNYRGLCLTSCLGKLFCVILHNRLTEKIKSENLQNKYQIGFTEGSSTFDHVFVIKCIVEKYLKNKKKVYACFLDFKKCLTLSGGMGCCINCYRIILGDCFIRLSKVCMKVALFQ